MRHLSGGFPSRTKDIIVSHLYLGSIDSDNPGAICYQQLDAAFDRCRGAQLFPVISRKVHLGDSDKAPRRRQGFVCARQFRHQHLLLDGQPLPIQDR